MARITDIGRNTFTATTGVSSDFVGVAANAMAEPFREIFDNLSPAAMTANFTNAIGAGMAVPIINDAISSFTDSIKSSNDNYIKTQEVNEEISDHIEDNRSELEKIRDILEDIYASMKGESFADIEERRETARRSLIQTSQEPVADSDALDRARDAAQSLGGIGKALIGLGSFRIAGMLGRVASVLGRGVIGLVKFLGPVGILASTLLSLNEKDWGQIIDEITTGISEMFDEGHFLTGALRITGAVVDAITIGITRVAANIAGWLGFNDAADWLQNLANEMNMAQAMVDAYEAVIEGVVNTWNGLKSLFDNYMPEWASDVPKFLYDNTLGLWVEATEKLFEGDIKGAFWALIPRWIKDLGTWLYYKTLYPVIQAFHDLTGQDIKNAFKKVVPEWLWNAGEWWYTTITKPVLGMLYKLVEQDIGQAFKDNIPEWMWNAGEWLYDKMLKPIVDIFEELEKGFADIKQNVIDMMPKVVRDFFGLDDTIATRLRYENPIGPPRQEDAPQPIDPNASVQDRLSAARRELNELRQEDFTGFGMNPVEKRQRIQELGEKIKILESQSSLVPVMRDSSQMLPSIMNQSAQNNIVAPVDNRTYNISQGNSGNQSRGPAPRVSTSPMQLSTLDRRIDSMFFGSISSI